MKEVKQKRPTCYNKHLQTKGEKPLSNVCSGGQVVEKEACRGRMWKNDGQRTISAWAFLL